MKSLSATRYSTFDMCPLRYQYQYINKLIQKKSDALEIGSLYHKMLEVYHLNNSEESAWNIIKEHENHREMLTHLFTKYLDQPLLGNVLEVEYEFRIDVPGSSVPLHGFIDRIDEDKGVEYKTASKKWKEEDANTIQTDIYLYALLKKFGRPFPLVYSINNKKTKMPPQIIRIERTEKEILSLEKRIVEFLNDVEKSKFEANPGQHCYMCPWGNKGDGTCSFSK